MSKNPRSGSLGETRLPREEYSMATESIRKMVSLPLDWVDWLEAMIPTYDSVLDRAGPADTIELQRIKGMRDALHLLRTAYQAQHPKARN